MNASDPGTLNRAIAKIVGSTDHATYVATEFPIEELDSRRPGERGAEVSTNDRDDFGIGSYVRIGAGPGSEIIGMIVSSRLVPEEGFDLGAFQGSDLELFTPELGNAAQRLLIIAGLGECTGAGEMKDGLPGKGPRLHDPVRVLPDEEIVAIHQRSETLNLAYLPCLTRGRDPQRIESALRGLKKLRSLLPSQGPVLDLLIQEMEWSFRVEK